MQGNTAVLSALSVRLIQQEKKRTRQNRYNLRRRNQRGQARELRRLYNRVEGSIR